MDRLDPEDAPAGAVPASAPRPAREVGGVPVIADQDGGAHQAAQAARQLGPERQGRVAQAVLQHEAQRDPVPGAQGHDGPGLGGVPPQGLLDQDGPAAVGGGPARAGWRWFGATRQATATSSRASAASGSSVAGHRGAPPGPGPGRGRDRATTASRTPGSPPGPPRGPRRRPRRPRSRANRGPGSDPVSARAGRRWPAALAGPGGSPMTTLRALALRRPRSARPARLLTLCLSLAALAAVVLPGLARPTGSPEPPGDPDHCPQHRRLHHRRPRPAVRVHRPDAEPVVYDTLVTVDAPDFTRVQPKLATKWEVSKDGTVLHLHPPAGSQVRLRQPGDRGRRPLLLPPAEEPQGQPGLLPGPGEGDRGGERHGRSASPSRGPDASFLAALAAAPQCGILDAKTVMEKGGTDADDAKEKDKATQWLNENSAGSGPYRLMSARKNEEIVLERNPTHWGPKPYFAKIVFRHVKDGTTQREMVERGDADVAQGLDADLVAGIKPGPRLALVEGLTMNFIYLALTNKADLLEAAGGPAGARGHRVRHRLRRDHQGPRPGRGRPAAGQHPHRAPGRRREDGAEARRRAGQAAPGRGRLCERVPAEDELSRPVPCTASRPRRWRPRCRPT